MDSIYYPFYLMPHDFFPCILYTVYIYYVALGSDKWLVSAIAEQLLELRCPQFFISNDFFPIHHHNARRHTFDSDFVGQDALFLPAASRSPDSQCFRGNERGKSSIVI